MSGNGHLKKATTAQLKAAFLDEFRARGRVDKAAEAVGIARTTPYEWAKKDKEFATAWEEGKPFAAGILEDEAFRRGHEGTLKPVFYQGEECGVIREYSDTLLIFLLKGLKPDKYRERYDMRSDNKHEYTGSVQIYLPDNGRDDG
jgi:hypothetical protein